MRGLSPELNFGGGLIAFASEKLFAIGNIVILGASPPGSVPGKKHSGNLILFPAMAERQMIQAFI